MNYDCECRMCPCWKRMTLANCLSSWVLARKGACVQQERIGGRDSVIACAGFGATHCKQGVQDERVAGAGRLHGAGCAEGLPWPRLSRGSAECRRQAHGLHARLGGMHHPRTLPSLVYASGDYIAGQNPPAEYRQRVHGILARLELCHGPVTLLACDDWQDREAGRGSRHWIGACSTLSADVTFSKVFFLYTPVRLR